MENNLLVENNGVLEIETETLKELNRLRAEKRKLMRNTKFSQMPLIMPLKSQQMAKAQELVIITLL